MAQKTKTLADLAQTDTQPILRVPCEVYSRIVGYLRPIQNWHEGKQQEFGERKTFRVAAADAEVAETASR